jgi:hypothetical protein
VKVDADKMKSESHAVNRQLAATQINATVFRAGSIAAKIAANQMCLGILPWISRRRKSG